MFVDKKTHESGFTIIIKAKSKKITVSLYFNLGETPFRQQFGSAFDQYGGRTRSMMLGGYGKPPLPVTVVDEPALAQYRDEVRGRRRRSGVAQGKQLPTQRSDFVSVPSAFEKPSATEEPASSLSTAVTVDGEKKTGSLQIQILICGTNFFLSFQMFKNTLNYQFFPLKSDCRHVLPVPVVSLHRVSENLVQYKNSCAFCFSKNTETVQ